MNAASTNPRQTHKATAKLSPERLEILRKLVWRTSLVDTIWLLQTSPWTMGALLSEGHVEARTAERIGELLDIIGRPS